MCCGPAVGPCCASARPTSPRTTIQRAGSARRCTGATSTRRRTSRSFRGAGLEIVRHRDESGPDGPPGSSVRAGPTTGGLRHLGISWRSRSTAPSARASSPGSPAISASLSSLASRYSASTKTGSFTNSWLTQVAASIGAPRWTSEASRLFRPASSATAPWSLPASGATPAAGVAGGQGRSPMLGIGRDGRAVLGRRPRLERIGERRRALGRRCLDGVLDAHVTGGPVGHGAVSRPTRPRRRARPAGRGGWPAPCTDRTAPAGRPSPADVHPAPVPAWARVTTSGSSSAAAGSRKISSVGGGRSNASSTAPFPPSAVITSRMSGPNAYGAPRLILTTSGIALSSAWLLSLRSDSSASNASRSASGRWPTYASLIRSASPSTSAVRAPADAVSESAAAARSSLSSKC